MLKLFERQSLFIGIFFILLSCVCWGAYSTLSDKLRENEEVRTGLEAKLGADLLSDWIKECRRALELAASGATTPTDARIEFPSGHAAHFPSYSDIILYTTEQQNTLPEAGGRIDPGTRALWLQALSQQLKADTFAGPLPALYGTGYELLLLRPLRSSEGAFAGVLGLRIPLDTLQQKTRAFSNPFPQERKIFLLNNQRQVLVPAPVKLPLTAAQDHTDEKGIEAALETAESQGRRIVAKDTAYYVSQAPVPGTPWSIALLTPETVELPMLLQLRNALLVIWGALALFTLYLFTRTRKYSHYKTLSEHDPLTKASNRLAFEKNMDSLRETAKLPVTLLLMDVDGLKIINDSVGHETGDAILKRLSTTALQTLRDKDVLYRIGGDEFAVIFSDMPLPMAQALAERILQQTVKLRSDKSLPPLHVSIGLAEAATANELENLFRRADEAMYLHKNQNRAVSAYAIRQWLVENPSPAERRRAMEA